MNKKNEQKNKTGEKERKKKESQFSIVQTNCFEEEIKGNGIRGWGVGLGNQHEDEDKMV